VSVRDYIGVEVVTLQAQTTVGIRELKSRLSEFVDRARAGEVITVTDRGRAVAELRPARARSTLDALIAEGFATVPDSRRPLPRPVRGKGDGGLTDIVEDQRR
jgi:prevent-host-death family protein